MEEIEKTFILKSLENQERIDKEIAKSERECWEEIDTLLQVLKDKEAKIKELKDKLKEDINKFSNNKNEVFMTQSSQIDASLISYGKELLNILEE